VLLGARKPFLMAVCKPLSNSADEVTLMAGTVLKSDPENLIAKFRRGLAENGSGHSKRHTLPN
jgi:hypothetical protein